MGTNACDWPDLEIAMPDLAISRIKNVYDDCHFVDDGPKKKINQNFSAISRTPFFGKKFPKLSNFFCKNRSAYRRINTVCQFVSTDLLENEDSYSGNSNQLTINKLNLLQLPTFSLLAPT